MTRMGSHRCILKSSLVSEGHPVLLGQAGSWSPRYQPFLLHSPPGMLTFLFSACATCLGKLASPLAPVGPQQRGCPPGPPLPS